MGRRATSTTKSGKFMNPTDQARKEARKKELKKNKKQRLLVRQAVLRSKDPPAIILELEKLDAMEYDPEVPPPLHTKVIQEKRRKLLETYHRVMRLHQKEEPDKWLELKRTLHDYEKRRSMMEEYANAVRSAREVNPSEIPLPDQSSTVGGANLAGIQIPGFPPLFGIPLPTADVPLHSILRRPAGGLDLGAKKEPPGPPPGEPPQLTDSEDERNEDSFEQDSDRRKSNSKKRAVRFKDKGDSGTESEEERQDEKDTRTKYKELARLASAEGRSGTGANNEPLGKIRPQFPMPPQAAGGPMGAAFRPPLLRPPGPPPGLPMHRFGAVLPPGMSPHFQMFPTRHVMGSAASPLASSAVAAQATESAGAVLYGAPAINKSKLGSTAGAGAAGVGEPGGAGGPIIEAKPQLRNMTAELTRLVPTAVKIRRDASLSKSKINEKESNTFQHHAHRVHHESYENVVAKPRPTAPPQQRTKDDAYDQFMREMSGLL